QDATAYTVSYYESQADADTGMAAAITNPNAYVNQSANPQTIFVRVENNNDPSCYETSSFLIQSFLSGIANTPNPLYICDNGQSTNVIDLTQNTPIVLGAQSLADFNITYYETQAAADANEVGITDPSNYTYLEEDQEIFVRIENIEREECYNLTSFELNVTTVVIGAVDLQQECDNGTPGTAFFDLTENNIAALAGQSPSNYTVDYYASQDDLDNDVVIADYTNYENTSNPQTVYVKVSSYNPQDCFLTTSFDIEATPSAAIFDPSPLMACDSDNDGFYTLFDLSSKDQEITGGNDDVSVSYHLTLSDAENNVDALNSPYSNISAFNQTVYVRALDELNGCVQTTTLELQVYDRPMIETPADLEACDDATADGQTYFDLTSVEEEVLDGLNPADYEITYHNNEADAIAGGNAISGPGGYFSQAPTQQVWIRVEDIVTPAGCYSVEPLTLIVHPLPEPVQPTALESCDDLTSGSDTDELVVFDLTEKEGEITGGDTSLSVIWYATPADFSNGVSIADPQNYTNDLDNAQTIIAEVTDEQGCSATTTLTLIVNPLPSPTPTDELEAYVICDDDNDGFAEFDLSTYEEEIANGEADVEITFYATQANAEGGDPDDELPNLYTNIQVNTQVIYARSTNINTGCYRYVELTLSVTALPDFVETEDGALDLFICDGEDGNNTGIFDLTQNTPLIYGTQSAEDFSVSYYESEADAANAEDPIGNPSAYSNAGVSPLSVWFRIEDEDTGCYRIGSFGLNVGSDPSISNPSKLSVCDDSALAADDEIGLFDLTAAIPEITNNDTSLSVYFYENAAALAADNPIADPENYQNIANAQTLEVRVIGENTCPAHTTLTLEVTPNPSLALELEAIEECDGDNDGFTEFDLEAEIDNILNGEPNVTITFHISENAANLGTNPITNTDVYSTTNIYQTIYVRAENTGPNGNDGTGCYTVRPLELIQIASPEIQLELEDLYVCDDESPNGFTSFDLTQNEDNILGDVDASDLEITYHTNEQEAIDGVNAIAVPTNYTNTSNGQTIYVRLENTTTGCIDTFGFDGDNSFTLNVNELPPLSYPTDLNVCDDDYDNDPYSSTLFDLTVKETEIFGGVPAVPSQYEFTYYANAEDLNNGIAIDTPEGYENIANPQTIYVVVEDTSGTTVQCSAEVSFDLQVLPLPSPSTTDPDVLRQTACDDDNDGVALDPFDLSLSGQLISQGENVTISYYKTLEAAEDEDAAELIGTPTAYLNEPSYNEVDQTGAPTNVQVIYARVDSNATGNFCYVVVPFELVVQPVPVLNEAIDDLAFGYTVCSDDAGGLTGAFYPEDVAGQVYDYNGGDFDTSLIVPLLDQNTPTNGVIEDYTLSFHFSVADALAGENAVPFGYQASNGEQFYIQLTHTLTGCMLTEESDLGILHINVAPRPTIADVDLSRMLCSNNEGEDTATINLQDFDTNIDNNATPPTTEVYYYASEVDYDNGDRIPETAESTYLASDGDVIYAEVINTDTFCTSTNVVMIPITVDARPSVDISDYDQLYICVDSDPSTPVTDGDYSAIIIDTGLDATAYSFEWTYGGTVLAGETGPSITVGGGSSNPLQAGDYSVQVFDLNTLDENNNNCGSDIDTVTILESNPPEFEVAPTSLGFEGEHSLQVFNVSGIGEYEFSIDNGPWVDLSGVTIDFDGLSAGTHIVYGRDKNGCGVTASEVISFIDFPPFFTPNDDGYNDYWNIIGLDTPLNRGAKIFIFDRYGKLLKQLSPSSRGWDGTYNGNPLPSGDYWFSVEYQDPGIPQEDGSLAEPT
ncbi:T9SS type B sorting domain-containing protein, partial [Mesonia mobilis]